MDTAQLQENDVRPIEAPVQERALPVLMLKRRKTIKEEKRK